jgi:hypothetical protein
VQDTRPQEKHHNQENSNGHPRYNPNKLEVEYTVGSDVGLSSDMIHDRILWGRLITWPTPSSGKSL